MTAASSLAGTVSGGAVKGGSFMCRLVVGVDNGRLLLSGARPAFPVSFRARRNGRPAPGAGRAVPPADRAGRGAAAPPGGQGLRGGVGFSFVQPTSR
ncbi:hypothetical protein GCM10009678_56940 [Actinomadura kijaniata]